MAGANQALENSPAYIDAAILAGYDVEIDLRFIAGGIFLGHDDPVYEVDLDWVLKRKDRLYVHAKTLETVQFLSSLDDVHFFFHDEDDCTLTSRKTVWVHPKARPIEGCIFVMPERSNVDMKDMLICSAICTDHVIHYEQEYNILKVVHNERQKN